MSMPEVEEWDITQLWGNLGPGGRLIGIVVALLYLGLIVVAQAFMGFFAPVDTAVLIGIYAIPVITVFVLAGVWAVLAICMVIYRAIRKQTFDNRDKFVITFFPMLIGLAVVLVIGLLRLIFSRRIEEVPPEQTEEPASADQQGAPAATPPK